MTDKNHGGLESEHYGVGGYMGFSQESDGSPHGHIGDDSIVLRLKSHSEIEADLDKALRKPRIYRIFRWTVNLE